MPSREAALNHPASILVTGATGFLGSCLLAKLGQMADICVLGAHRVDLPFADHPIAVVGDIDNDTDWRSVVHWQAVVIHSAARVHAMHDTSPDKVLPHGHAGR